MLKVAEKMRDLGEIESLLRIISEDFYHSHIFHFGDIPEAMTFVGRFYYVRDEWKNRGHSWVSAVNPYRVGQHVLIAHDLYIDDLKETSQ